MTRPQADYSRFIRLDIMKGRNVPDVLKEHRMESELFSDEYQHYFVADNMQVQG